MKLKGKAIQLKTDIPALFLCLKSEETPQVTKLLAWITVAYALSPIYLIPDFIPVEMWKDGKPKKWYFGIPIVMI